MVIKFNTIKEENLEQIMKWRTNPEVSQYMFTDPELDIEKQLHWFKTKVCNNDKEKYWIVNVENMNIGLVCIYNIDLVNKRVYWAYYIGDNRFKGKGVGKQIELNILKHVFEKMRFNKVCCEVFCFNEMVIQLHEKFGSKVEGILRKHIYKNGKFYDIVTMGILKEEWDKIKHTFDIMKVIIE